jgi:hypothetical protein
MVGKCRTFRNDNKLSHLPTTQCACADFGDFAKQRNGGGGGGREKDTRNKHFQKICVSVRVLIGGDKSNPF